MEDRSDNVRAFLYAIGVHVLCLAVAFSGLLWWQSTKVVQAAGEPIEAVFIETGSLRPVTPPPRPQPPRPRVEQPTPPKPPEPTPTDQTAQDLIEQQRIDRLAQFKAEEEAREQEEKRKRAEQILLEEEQKRREEEERKRQEQQRIEREKAEEEAREKAEEAAREEAEREAREKAEREAREKAEREAAAAQAGNRGQDDGLLARYGAAITRAVHAQWRLADNAPPTVCTLRIIQIPGGEILDASVVNPCNADDAVRTSLERAARNAQPLPYAGFESVFRRQLVIKFCHPQDHPECMQ
jgi:colicin import membrane protein